MSDRKTPRLRAALIRRRWGAGGLAPVLLALAASVYAAEALDTDLMQAIEDTHKSLASNIATGDQRAASAEAAELHAMFLQVEAHYTAQPEAAEVADAVALTRKSLALARSIGQQVQAGDFGTAAQTSTELGRTCKSCHNFYKKS